MIFSIQYNTEFGESLRLVSGDDNWPMFWGEGNVWSVKIVKPRFIEYHYEVVKDGKMLRRELAEHILLQVSPRTQNDSWKEWDVNRGAGVAVPIFSLRSKEDFGIGDFRDLSPLVDWAAKCGLCVIQLLPVNDTTRGGDWDDSYPYKPVSSFALNPMYVRIQDLFPSEANIEQDEEFKKDQKALNDLPQVDYPKVYAAKMKYIRRAYELAGAKDIASHHFQVFAHENAFWLEGYADYCVERDASGAAKKAKASAKKTSERDFYRWLQFHLDAQFFDEAEKARRKGIIFKGDLPIGVSRDSVEVKTYPDMFNLDCSVGAPPDYFSEDGQNWGFPSYNWDKMEKNGFLWWKTRLRHMNRYFGAFRIDHVLGWFRIWEIPLGASGKMGYFNPAIPYSKDELSEFFDAKGNPDERLFLKAPRNKGGWFPLISPDTSFLSEDKKRQYGALWEDFFWRRNDEFWREYGERKIPELLSATGMLPCAEDLGMVPYCVNEVMAKYRMLSLEIPSFEKGRPWPYLSVCTTSTHDMDPLRCQNRDDLSAIDCSNIIRGVMASDSMLAILPLQDYLAMSTVLRAADPHSERINNPSDPHNHWCWRVHFPLEDLMAPLGDAAMLRSDVEMILFESHRFRG